MKVLITGGAGFIGAHVANELLQTGHSVRALDSLHPQVHGTSGKPPAYLSADVDLKVGDVRDAATVEACLDRVDAVIHLAALVGVGQSMYEIATYTHVNTFGTAQLMQAVTKRGLQRVVIASSMSVYGEGAYVDEDGRPCRVRPRTSMSVQTEGWEPRSESGGHVRSVPTNESKPPSLASIYALSKYDQEQIGLILGSAYGIPTVALRFFNTYGPNQALSNPYTGVLSNFASRVLNGRPPLIYEDGEQKRDFVSVYDVARACRLALTSERAVGHAINISSGQAMTVVEAARQTIRALGAKVEPEISGKWRAGDIRHCFAAIDLARDLLGWAPLVSFEAGLQDLAAWLDGQAAEDRAVQSREELANRGLLV